MTEHNEAVERFAAGIAADIRRQGHYRGQGPHFVERENPDGPCCLIYSPTYLQTRNRGALLNALRARLDAGDDIAGWSNKTPTDDLLAALDAIAAPSLVTA